jgi:DNA-binding NtrC family response regulator
MSAAAVTPPIRVLLADDEPHLGTILAQFLGARGHAVTVVHDGRAALDALADEAYDVALLDVVMPEVDGLEVLRRVREAPAPPEVLVLTGNGTVETTLSAMRLGAYQVLSKPYRMAEIEAVVRRAWEKRVLRREQQRWAAWRRRLDPVHPFLSAYAPLRAVLTLVQAGAPGMAPMLVTGAPGTGKRCLARQLHQWGDTPGGPVVEWTVAGTAPAHHALELHGEARSDVPALLELAAGGMLVVHGVEALAPEAMRPLLDAVTTGVWRTADGRHPRALEARVVATSVASVPPAGAQPLWDGLGALRVALPVLAERRVDLPLLAQHFLEQAVSGAPPRLTASALEAMEQYAWPGQVRELRAVMERAALLARGGVVDAALIPGGAGAAVREPTAGERTPPPSPPAEELAALEREHIAAVLEAAGWHQGRAAERLGISPKTLYRKIRAYGLVRPVPRRRRGRGMAS